MQVRTVRRRRGDGRIPFFPVNFIYFDETTSLRWLASCDRLSGPRIHGLKSMHRARISFDMDMPGTKRSFLEIFFDKEVIFDSYT